ncbi:MAG: hypothetical protein H6Q68_3711 [Firmicutes bacterium]|nr:hypothetical protein [Bacillota bacterium]
MLNLESFKKCKDKKLRNSVLKEIKVLTRASVRELSMADQALYRAKGEGRNRVNIYEEDIDIQEEEI